jgi:hypothetical protein
VVFVDRAEQLEDVTGLVLPDALDVGYQIDRTLDPR